MIAVYRIIKAVPESLRVSREKKRREEEHREYMTAYNTRRQLYGEVYSVSRKYKLIGNENKEMQENISFCNEDDEVEVDFDDKKNKHTVACNGSIIGYLPKPAMEAMSKISDYKAIITAIGFTSMDKYYVQISVYYND